MLASVLAGKWLIAVPGKLAAVRAGSDSSVVHRGAFLIKTRFACPRRSAMQGDGRFAGTMKYAPVPSCCRKNRATAGSCTIPLIWQKIFFRGRPNEFQK
ncbi:hypothetical protein [Cupriavidus necator]|uniref:hypothetical protein n=1 Tax=Cupriavidus necator TaxID=106590 RepID=UPI003F734FA8